MLATLTCVCVYALIRNNFILFGYREKWSSRILWKNLNRILVVYWHAVLKAARAMNNTWSSDSAASLCCTPQSFPCTCVERTESSLVCREHVEEKFLCLPWILFLCDMCFVSPHSLQCRNTNCFLVSPVPPDMCLVLSSQSIMYPWFKVEIKVILVDSHCTRERTVKAFSNVLILNTGLEPQKTTS